MNIKNDSNCVCIERREINDYKCKQKEMHIINKEEKRKDIINNDEMKKPNKDKEKDKEKDNDKNKNKDKEKNNVFNDIASLKTFLGNNCKEFNEKFELLEMINSGSAGAVYKGKLRKNINSKLIAFKFLFNNNKKEKKEKNDKKSKDKNKSDCNNHFEISIHGILKCKHIPAIYGYYKIQDSSCIAMEFTQYGDIENLKKKILKRSSLSETIVLYIAGGILEALYYIHVKNKIIHMDIKQQNVLIDDYLNIKLTDFSVSINYKNKSHINLPMVGTCYYMSPEVLGQKRISASEASKIDIYSLGVLLYLLAFYDYPYKLNEVSSKDYGQIAKNIEEQKLEFPEDTGHSKVFLNFLKNCLNKDIKQRYDIHQAMNDVWFKGYKIILDEKEKIYNASKFLIDLMVDNLITLNKYLKTQETFL